MSHALTRRQLSESALPAAMRCGKNNAAGQKFFLLLGMYCSLAPIQRSPATAFPPCRGRKGWHIEAYKHYHYHLSDFLLHFFMLSQRFFGADDEQRREKFSKKVPITMI